jgi:phage terminase small subunit
MSDEAAMVPKGQRALRTQELTEQQKLFVLEYLIDLNGTGAAIRAGYDPITAGPVANKLLKKGSLTQIAVSRALAERSKRVGISADRVLRELGRLAFGDTRVLFRPDGSLRAPTEYSDDDAAMIEGVKTRRIVEIGIDPENPGKQKLLPVEIQEVKLASKMAALTALMRHLGMNNDKLEVTMATPLAQRLAEAYARTGRSMTAEATMPSGETVDVEYEEVTDEQQPDNQQDAELRRMLGLDR